MSRRRKGTGSLVHKDGRWIASITQRDGQGKQVRKSATFTSAQQAETWLAEHQKSAKGLPELPEAFDLQLHDLQQMTLGTFLDVWLKVKKHRVKVKTWLDYERLVRLHLLPLQVSGLHLKGLSPLHLEGCCSRSFPKGPARPC